MASEASKRVNELFGKFRARFEKFSESVTAPKDDEDLIHAVIQRIDVDGEAAMASPPGMPPATEDKEQTYKKLLRRLDWQLGKSGIGVEEVVRTFPGEVQAVLLYKSYEKFKGGESNLLREKFIQMGWKNIQPNVWILPPNKTPVGPITQEDLKVWVRRKLTKPFGKEFDYVFPFVAVIDMKKVTADKKGTRKMPVARTIYNVLEPSEVVPASHLYAVMKSRGFSVREIILSGDIPFLASAFATTDDLLAIQENEEAIGMKLRRLTGSQSMALQDLANLGPDLIADAFGSAVAHPKDLAQRLIVEAQFWMRHLGGTVPSPGPTESAGASFTPGPGPSPETAESSPEPEPQPGPAPEMGPGAQSEMQPEAEPEAEQESESWSDSAPVPS
ncbi:MAG: hypothetical protein LYZ66_03005 [Nitrososphaerales archaeon]|nr:hypothetical protein [Nitrososphaerales archaeon]